MGFLCFTLTLNASYLWYLHYSEYQEPLYEIFEDQQALGISCRKFAYWLNEHNEY